MLITYDQAKEALNRGEKVEISYHDGIWSEFPYPGTHSPTCGCQFRLAAEPSDRYAHLKAAQAEGKVIQFNEGYGPWVDWPNPDWSATPSAYRIKPDELKIEAGKYQMRNGNKATVKWTDGPNERFPVVGYMDDDTYVFVVWTKSGQFSLSANPSDYDLIAPWTDAPAPYDNWDKVPAWANWQTKNQDGLWKWYSEKPTAHTYGWISTSYSGLIPTKFDPTNFTGNWEESLQERPK